MTQISMREMLEAGAHFGHQTRRWNPKMAPYIWGAKNGIHVIDLKKTHRLCRDALDFTSRLAQRGEKILFVGTKRQAQDVIEQEAQRCKQPFVNQRWLGGMLTNFRTIKMSIERIENIEQQLDVGNVERLPKKEVTQLERERRKLLKCLGGIRQMAQLPGAIFVIDTVKEHIAVSEAKRLKIPMIGVVDTNSNPEEIDYPIPSNDDAIRAIRLFAAAVADAYNDGSALNKETFAATPAAESKVDVIVRSAAAGAALADKGEDKPQGDDLGDQNDED
jgi:small subunit ribosomal protein S2